MRYILALLLTFSFAFSNSIMDKIDEVDLNFNSGYTDYEKWHEYSGYITLGLLGVTMLSTENRGIHETFGIASVISMTTTSGLGIYAHGDEVFDLTKGFKKIHWHSLVGALASVAMLATIAEAPEDEHQALGIIGGISAVISFAIVKW
jgi:uncharacterized membrane protein